MGYFDDLEQGGGFDRESQIEDWLERERERAADARLGERLRKIYGPRQPHTPDQCDEGCRCCARCYQASGIEQCGLTCEHAEENAS